MLSDTQEVLLGDGLHVASGGPRAAGDSDGSGGSHLTAATTAATVTSATPSLVVSVGLPTVAAAAAASLVTSLQKRYRCLLPLERLR